MSFITLRHASQLLVVLAGLFAASPTAWAAPFNLGYLMPIGDSITEGYDPGGWRDPLYTDLTNAGYAFTYEGSHDTYNISFGEATAGTTDGSTLLNNKGEDYNNGWSGYTMTQVYNSLSTWFASPYLAPSPNSSVLPKVITLEIGTNDIYDGISSVTTLDTNLNSIITQIMSLDPTADLIVAQITPFTGAYTSYNPTVVAFNATIPALAAQHDALGQNVSVVDLYDTIDLNGDDQHDGVHPNEAGDAKIAAAYLTAIQTVDPAPEPSILALLVPSAALLFYLRRPRGLQAIRHSLISDNQ